MKIADIPQVRAYAPEKITEALRTRKPARPLMPGEKHMIVACDHPARGALGAGSLPYAMADRQEVLARCVAALKRPGVTGFLGTADMVEDLALLGVLDGMHVFGSMNRTGLQGARFEIDDRADCYSPAGIVKAGLEGGKTLTRICYEDPATPAALYSTAQAVNALSAEKKITMIEPFVSYWEDGVIKNNLSPEAVIKSITVASGLGENTAYTWLKLPCVDDMERVMAATTLPSLILGGEVSQDAEAVFAHWSKVMRLPNIFGLVVGRSLLFPSDGDVEKAVDTAVELVR